MKKILILVSLILVVVLAAVACDKAPAADETTADTVAATEAATEVATEAAAATDAATDAATEAAEATDAATDAATEAEEATEAAEATEVETEAATEAETAAPAPAVTKVAIDLDECIISGHCTQVNTADSAAANVAPAVAAMGLLPGEKVAMLHQGSVCIPDVDLSKYSKVKITYTSDASDATLEALAATPNRIMLLTQDIGGTSPSADNTVLAYTEHVPTFASWMFTSAEIDLTGVNYTGDVYLSVDFIGGWFWGVLSIEFYEIAPEA